MRHDVYGFGLRLVGAFVLFYDSDYDRMDFPPQADLLCLLDVGRGAAVHVPVPDFRLMTRHFD